MLTLLTLREKWFLIVFSATYPESEMNYPFLGVLYIMQYLKFQLIKKQTPSTTPPRLSFTPHQHAVRLL